MAEDDSFIASPSISRVSIVEHLKQEKKRKKMEAMQCQMRVCTILLIINLLYMCIHDVSSYFLSSGTLLSPQPDTSLQLNSNSKQQAHTHSGSIFSSSRSSSEGFEVPVEIKDFDSFEPGVFAKELIPKGSAVWKSSKSGYSFANTDNRKLKEFLITLSEAELMYFLTHAYISDGVIRLTNTMFDFIHHNINGSLVRASDESDQLIAAHDIQPGEQLSQNHLEREKGPIWWVKMVLRARTSCENFLDYFRQTHQSWAKHCEFNIIHNKPIRAFLGTFTTESH